MSAWSPKWTTDGRRHSVSNLFHRLRSGSLPGWIGNVGNETSIVHPSSPKPTDITITNSGSHTQSSSKSKSSEGKQFRIPAELKQKKSDMTIVDQPVTVTLHSNSERKSSSSSDELASTTATWTTSSGGNSASTTRYRDDDLELVGPSTDPFVLPSPLNETERGDHFRDGLLQTVKVSTMDENDPNLYPSELFSIESSPLTLRKKEFTVIRTSSLHTDHHSDHLEHGKSSKRRGNANLGLVVSALYGKLLVVMGIAFPMAEVISTYIPPSFYDGFYLYLYFGSITFMICIYGNMVRQKATRSMRGTLQRITVMKSRFTTSATQHRTFPASTNPPPDIMSSPSDSEGCTSGSVIDHHHDYITHLDAKQRIHFGSFYLRIGAVAFGIGSMIYSGLEFGQYFELDTNTKCHNFMIALTPAVRMIFTFMQMYFIFLNSKMAVDKLQLGAQFGLAHMIGTNLCVWLNVLVQETRHEILMFYNPDNGTIIYPNSYQRDEIQFMKTHSHGHGFGHIIPETTTPTILTTTLLGSSAPFRDLNNTATLVHSRMRRGLKGPYSFQECRRSDIMGSLVQNASPFLFPCTIEFSLICSAVLYVMWKSIANNKRYHHGHFHGNGDLMHLGAKRSPHHYSVDCARANKGLFLGILVLVMTIISLIIFFVLINKPGYQEMAVLEVNITELILYTMSTLAVLIGMCQMRELRYIRSRNLELDNILLIVAQTGSFIYNVFTIIGGHFTMKKNTALVLVTALSSLIQLLVQTLFILDSSKRSAATSEQARRKPGREVVTFLLVTNLAMWAISTLEKSRADSHPVQLKFYGVWAWTIITHISMPLAIFYRFHSTVCLCEIWKRAYKVKPPVYR